MSVQDSTQTRRTGTQRDKGVGLIVTNGRATGKEPAGPGLHGEMSVTEWRRWRQRIRRRLARPLPLVQRGFLEGQLFRLGSHPVDAEEAEPPCMSAVVWIEELERIQKKKIERRRQQ